MSSERDWPFFAARLAYIDICIYLPTGRDSRGGMLQQSFELKARFFIYSNLSASGDEQRERVMLDVRRYVCR